MIKAFVKKPVKVQAVQWTGDNYEELVDFVGGVRSVYIRPYHKRTCNMKYLDTWLISSMPIEKQIKTWNKRY